MVAQGLCDACFILWDVFVDGCGEQFDGGRRVPVEKDKVNGMSGEVPNSKVRVEDGVYGTWNNIPVGVVFSEVCGHEMTSHRGDSHLNVAIRRGIVIEAEDLVILGEGLELRKTV